MLERCELGVRFWDFFNELEMAEQLLVLKVFGDGLVVAADWAFVITRQFKSLGLLLVSLLADFYLL